MNLQDIRERTGPYWAAYQTIRRRDEIIDNPDYVPPWFVAKLARERVAAARVALEQLARPVRGGGVVHRDDAHEVWRALRTIEQHIREGHILEPTVEAVVAGLLGAQEIETARERRDVEAERRRANPRRADMYARMDRELLDVCKRNLREDGITTSAELAALHAEQDESRAKVRSAEYRALDEMAEEARA